MILYRGNSFLYVTAHDRTGDSREYAFPAFAKTIDSACERESTAFDMKLCAAHLDETACKIA